MKAIVRFLLPALIIMPITPDACVSTCDGEEDVENCLLEAEARYQRCAANCPGAGTPELERDCWETCIAGERIDRDDCYATACPDVDRTSYPDRKIPERLVPIRH